MSEDSAPVSVSVCIPTYNGAAFLAEAIQSILTQSFQDFEIVIVDDRSTDATFDIARSFTDSRIRLYLNDERLGVPRNWNRCLTLAEGEYFCLFDQNTVMLPENLARKVAVLDCDPTISFVYSAMGFLEQERVLPASLERNGTATKDCVFEGQQYFRNLLLDDIIEAPTILVRRQLLQQLGGFEEVLGSAADYALWMQLCVERHVAVLQQPLVLCQWSDKKVFAPYYSEQRVQDVLVARRRALQYYEEQTGQKEEGKLLRTVVQTLVAFETRMAQLDQQTERQQTYIGELEQARVQLETMVQEIRRAREGRSQTDVDDQQVYLKEIEQRQADINEQQAYIKELEQLYDQLRADMQKMGKRWEKQQTYLENQRFLIDHLKLERDLLISEREKRIFRRLRRFARRVSGRRR